MSVTAYFYHIGLPGIALFIFLENMGIPLPSESAYIVAQALITSHRANYLTVLLVLQAAHFFGSWSSYELGLRFRHSQRIRNSEQKVSEISKTLTGWLAKYGVVSIFFSRLIGYVRPWASYVAGAAEIPRRTFLLWSFLGSLVFNVVALSVTRTIVHIWQHYPATRFAMTIIFFVSVLGVIAWEVSKRPSPKPISVQEP